MKKLFCTLLTAVCITLFTSCSSDDASTTDQGIQKTNVAFVIDQPTTSTTSKQIKRGDIPVWVNTIKITATSNVFGGYSVNDNYTFDEQHGENYIGLDNVAVGSNTFVGTTTTDSSQFYQLTNYTVNSGTAKEKFETALANIKSNNPYVLYNGTVTSNVATSGTNIITIPMTTLNGRLLAVFQADDFLKTNGYQAKITASVPGLTSLTATTKGNELVTFKWSDVSSVNDKVVSYKVEISSINNQDVILETYKFEQAVIASKSISCFYTIGFDKVVPTFPIGGGVNNITLNFQEWKDEHCATCPKL